MDNHDNINQTPQQRQPIFNLPKVVLAFLFTMGGIHMIRSLLLTTNQDTLLLTFFAFLPLRYESLTQIDIFTLMTPVSYSVLHGSLSICLSIQYGWQYLVQL